jgi:NADH-quinone oxidoreductase subunit B
MGIEEHLPGGLLLTTVEKVAGYARAHSVWPAFSGLACCAMEVLSAGGPRHDLARFGMEKVSNTPRQADLMIVSGLPGCPPRPEMLIDAIVKLHDKIQNMKLGANREREVTELEQARFGQATAGAPG